MFVLFDTGNFVMTQESWTLRFLQKQLLRMWKEYNIEKVIFKFTWIKHSYNVVCLLFLLFTTHMQLICCLGEGDLDLVEQLMNFLLGRQVDSSYVVRMICIQGLGNIAAVKGQVCDGGCILWFSYTLTCIHTYILCVRRYIHSLCTYIHIMCA